MFVNSIKIDLTDKVRSIDLFAGIGGLNEGMKNSFKKNSVRMTAGRDAFL